MSKSYQKIVIAQLPKAGIGNKLYVWAKAAIFSQINNIDYYCIGWTRFQLGTFIRGEKSNRLYLGQFRQPNIEEYLRLIPVYLTAKQTIEPNLSKIYDSQKQVFIFQKITGTPDDSFQDFLPFRQYLRDEIMRILDPKMHQFLSESPSPIIGIHVRRGDFKFTPWLTSIDYFVQKLTQIREISGTNLPATIFSDGSQKDLAPLLNLPNVTLARPNPDIVDMLLLSRSRILIPCPASTFSNWSAFLSEDENIIIRHYIFTHKPVRQSEVNARFFEGVVGDNIFEWPELLVENIKMITSK
jgi:hypothetical protein